VSCHRAMRSAALTCTYERLSYSLQSHNQVFTPGQRVCYNILGPGDVVVPPNPVLLQDVQRSNQPS
jgi:hypothetical protein